MLQPTAADYLEEAAREDLIARLEGRGYRVAREVPVGDQRVDLLAERDGERIAYEIKARSRLKESAQQIEARREAARRSGVSGFRVLVAVPPHAVDVTIEDFEPELRTYLREHPLTDVPKYLPSGTRVENVIDIEIDTVELARSGIRVRGRGYVDVAFNDGAVVSDDTRVYDSLPFSFDVELDSALHIKEMHAFTLDTSVFVT
jgi:Holliday junction resolvase